MARTATTTHTPTVRRAGTARHLTNAGLVVAPLGIGVLILSGVDFPDPRRAWSSRSPGLRWSRPSAAGGRPPWVPRSRRSCSSAC